MLDLIDNVCFVIPQVAYSYTYELRPYLDLLLQILLIEDSWQTHRYVTLRGKTPGRHTGNVILRTLSRLWSGKDHTLDAGFCPNLVPTHLI